MTESGSVPNLVRPSGRFWWRAENNVVRNRSRPIKQAPLFSLGLKPQDDAKLEVAAGSRLPYSAFLILPCRFWLLTEQGSIRGGELHTLNPELEIESMDQVQGCEFHRCNLQSWARSARPILRRVCGCESGQQ